MNYKQILRNQQGICIAVGLLLDTVEMLKRSLPDTEALDYLHHEIVEHQTGVRNMLRAISEQIDKELANDD